MPLTNAPTLDDLTFQQIVDRVKSQIAIYCPEWTDHNVSDPGVTLIELFASMVDMLLYRVNRLPEQVYRAFLDLIGARLDPARPATADVTFYLTAAYANKAVAIDEGAEVATVRTENTPPIAFSTIADLRIRPARLLRAYRVVGPESQPSSWTDAKLDASGRAAQPFAVFASPDMPPRPSNALYLELADDHGMHVLAIGADCVGAAGGGARLDQPPWEWHVSAPDGQSWAKCVVERDETRGFNREGVNDVVLRLPAMGQRTLPAGPGAPHTAFWLRCSLSQEQGKETEPGVFYGYNKSPSVRALAARSIGGTAPAQQATVVKDEALGAADGTPYQTFRLQHGPLLARDRDRERLIVITPDGQEQRWSEVDHFADSRPDHRHYTLDHDGTLRFGPLLAQPDGTFRAFGAPPPKGGKLKFTRYRYGGGAAGNVPAETLVIRKVARPEIARVTNWAGAIGGRNAQTIEDARLRAPAYLHTRTRAVTAEDFVYLAERLEGVQRAACLPGAQPGEVAVIVLPEPRQSPPLEPFDPALRGNPADPLFERVAAALQERAVLGANVVVRPPRYIYVKVDAEVVCEPSSSAEQREAIRQRALEALYRFLHPHAGGPGGGGWPFGRRLSDGMVKHALQAVAGVEVVEQVLLTPVEWSDDGKFKLSPSPGLIVDVPPDGVICSFAHQIAVTR